MTAHAVLHKIQSAPKPLSEQRTKELIAAGIQRAVFNHTKAAVAKAAGCNTRTIDNYVAMNTLPDIHTAGNILALEPTALWEYLAEIGFKVVPLEMMMSPDMRTATEMSDCLTTLIRALEDGSRDHIETQALAKKLRPLIPKLAALVDEADSHRVGRK